MKLYFLPAILLIFTFAPISAFAQSESDRIQQLERAVEELQDQAEITADEAEEANLRLDERPKISGFVDIEYRSSTEEGVHDSFKLHHLVLFISKTIAERWKVFMNIEFENAPRFEGEENEEGEEVVEGNGEIAIPAVNITYLWRPDANFRAGRFYTPAGIYSLTFHHLHFLPTQEVPAHIGEIFPQAVDGVEAYGALQMGNTFLNYNIYGGNGEGNSGKQDENAEKATGAKASFVLPALSYLELGTSWYQDTLNDGTDKTAYGLHTKLTAAGLTFQSEYATASLSPEGASSFSSIGYYSQLYYSVGGWLAGYRYDFFDSDDRAEVDEITNSIFVNFRPDPNVVFKIEWNQHDDEAEESHQETVLTWSLYFE